MATKRLAFILSLLTAMLMSGIMYETNAQGFTPPKPTGEYKVGTRYFHFVDTNRPEIFTENENDFREVFAQVWYPANPAVDASPKPYREKQEAILISAIMAETFGFLVSDVPVDFKSHLSNVITHSYLNAPVAKGDQSFPVLVYSHGILGGYVTTHTLLMEELASQGYIVFSISHNYQTPFVRYPDGSIKSFSKSVPAYRLAAKEVFDPNIRAPYAKLYETDNLERQKEIIKAVYQQQPFLEKSVYIWAADVSFTIDEIEKLNRNDQSFVGKIDLNRIGVLGWSFGGATSGQVCITDKRCKAGINLDGLPHGDLVDKEITQPFMFMRNGSRVMAQHFLNQVNNDVYVVKINGTTHFDFADMTMFNVPQINQILGKIKGQRAIDVVSRYTVGFFDKYLKGKRVPLLDGPSADFPEVEFKYQVAAE